MNNGGGIKFKLLKKESYYNSVICSILPLGRIEKILPNYHLDPYAHFTMSENMAILCQDAKDGELIEHIIDLCKLFTNNKAVIDEAKQLIMLKIRYYDVMKKFFRAIRTDLESRNRNNGDIKYCDCCGRPTKTKLYNDKQYCSSCMKTLLSNTVYFDFLQLKQKLDNDSIEILTLITKFDGMKDKTNICHSSGDFASCEQLIRVGLITENLSRFPRILKVTAKGRQFVQFLKEIGIQDEA